MIDKEINLTDLDCINKETLNLLDKANVLNDFINNLITSEILKNVSYDKAIILNLRKDIIERRKFKDEEDYFNWLKESNVTEEEFFGDIINNIKLTNFCLENYEHRTESLFLEKQDDLSSAIYSLIRVSDSYLANELYQRILNNESNFGDIASEFSLGPEKKSKGIIGPVNISQGHPIIRELIKTRKVGELSEPIRLGDFVIIFRLETFEKATLDQNTKISLSRDLFKSWLTKQSISKIHSLKVKYGISSK